MVVINSRSRHGVTDLYHGKHYGIKMLACGTHGAAIHGVHVHALSTEFKDSDNLGCLPNSRKVPVEALFNTPAITEKDGDLV